MHIGVSNCTVADRHELEFDVRNCPHGLVGVVLQHHRGCSHLDTVSEMSETVEDTFVLPGENVFSKTALTSMMAGPSSGLKGRMWTNRRLKNTRISGGSKRVETQVGRQGKNDLRVTGMDVD